MDNGIINRVDWPRPAKRDIFLFMSCINALLSTDSQTQCGCIITTKKTDVSGQRILGTGYNGFPRGVNEELCPNIRPDKYPWVAEQHAEKCAINNSILSPLEIGGGEAYVSGSCCFNCTAHAWNNGIDTIYQLRGFSEPKMVDSHSEELKKELVDKLVQSGHVLSIFDVCLKDIGPIFRYEQMEKIFDLFFRNGFDYHGASISKYME